MATAQSSHGVTIAAYYGMTSGSKLRTIRFNYLPDNIRYSIKSNFTEKQLPLTSSSILIYRDTPPQPVSFSLRVVGGLDDVEVKTGNSSTNGFGNAVGSEISASLTGGRAGPLLGNPGEPGTQIREYARFLSSLSAPADPTIAGNAGAGFPPPRCFLEVGGVFKGVGVFESIDIDYLGPWDAFGLPTSMDISFSFKPSVFYSGKSRVGFGDSSRSSDSAASAGSTAASNADAYASGGAGAANDLTSGIVLGPSELRFDGMRNSGNGFIIQYGG